MNSCNDNCCQFWQKVPLMFLEGCCLNFQIYFYWLCFLFTVCCRFVILVPQNSLPTPQKCHLLEHIRGWHLRWLAFQLSLLLTLSILQKVFVEWFSIPAEVGYAHAGGSLRFWTGGQLSLTPGQRIGKARRALLPTGVWGHAPPENFEIL